MIYCDIKSGVNRMEQVKVSIIMPVYGVEAYVGRAIESLQSQTLTEFELFAVDDGTKDRSGIICDEYAAKDSRIHVIHKENGGAPSARNTAIPMAKGKYMMFMDSDDWAEPNMLEEIYQLAEKTSAQMVVAGFFIDTYYSDTEYITNHFKYKDIVYKTAEEFRKDAYRLFDRNLLYTPWNKLFLSSYIHDNGLLFPQTLMDDFPFVLSCIRDMERITVTEKEYYHFIRARAESETAKYRPQLFEKREEEHDWMKDIYAHWGVNDDLSQEMIQRRYIERVIECIENTTNPNSGLTKKEKKDAIRRIITAENTRTALKVAKPRSVMMKIMLLPIRWKWVWLTYTEGWFISKIKSSNTKTFAKLKASR